MKHAGMRGRFAAVVSIGFVCLMALTSVAPLASAANTAHWSYGFPIGAGRGQATVVQDNNSVVYIMGGAGNIGTYMGDGACYAYNPGTGTWAGLTGMGWFARASSGGVYNDKIYIFSGYRDTVGQYTPVTQIYDIAGDSWSTGTNIPVAVWEAKCFNFGDHMVVVGGESNDDSYEDLVQIYNVTTDSWILGTPIPKGLIAGAAVVSGGYGYYIGGENSTGTVSDVYRYSLASNSWSQMASLPAPICGNSAIVGQDGLIYSVGGADSASNTPTIAYGNTSAYNIATNSWSVCNELNMPRAWLGLGLYDNKVIAVSGNDDVNWVLGVEVLDTSQSQISMLEDQITALQNKIAAANNNITSLDGQLTDLQNKNTALTQNVSDLWDSLNDTETALNNAIDAANNNANSKAGDAKTAADNANMMALIGIIVGILGIVLAAVALMMARNKGGKGPQMAPQQGQVQQ
jgi:N-acetylneuraminic acid mutarotase/uncharacterized coiled-coil protein SlyX